MKAYSKSMVIIAAVLLIAAIPLFGGCNGGEVTPTPTPTPVVTEEPTAEPTAEPEVSEFEVVQDAVDTYLTSGSTWNIKASDLFMLINDEEEDNDPYIISVRMAEDYAKGHIPGAINIGFGDLFKTETLATLPIDQQIVMYCYTGHSGSQATAMLGALGYDVVNLLHGMSAWTTDEEIAPYRFNPDTDRSDYVFETEANEATETYSFPVLENTASTDEVEIVKAAAASYASPKNITASDLYLLLNDEEEDNDPFIVSVRGAEDYAKGHIPGAINIGLTTLAQNLDKLPPDEPIVVYCYTGHTGSQATALLNMLGYDATNLRFGMVSWTQDTEVAPYAFDNSTVVDYATVSGTSPM